MRRTSAIVAGLIGVVLFVDGKGVDIVAFRRLRSDPSMETTRQPIANGIRRMLAHRYAALETPGADPERAKKAFFLVGI
jgi:hypothetical protein